MLVPVLFLYSSPPPHWPPWHFSPTDPCPYISSDSCPKILVLLKMQPLGLVLILALNHVLISALIVVLVSVLKSALISTGWFYPVVILVSVLISVQHLPTCVLINPDYALLYASTDASATISIELYPNKQSVGS
jgi:hypothetical protein